MQSLQQTVADLGMVAQLSVPVETRVVSAPRKPSPHVPQIARL